MVQMPSSIQHTAAQYCRVYKSLIPFPSLRITSHLYLVLLVRFGLVLHHRCHAVPVTQSAQITDRCDSIHAHDETCKDNDESDAVLPVKRCAGQQRPVEGESQVCDWQRHRRRNECQHCTALLPYVSK